MVFRNRALSLPLCGFPQIPPSSSCQLPPQQPLLIRSVTEPLSLSPDQLPRKSSPSLEPLPSTLFLDKNWRQLSIQPCPESNVTKQNEPGIPVTVTATNLKPSELIFAFHSSDEETETESEDESGDLTEF